MQRLSKRELAILLLCVGLGIGWCWDHVRCAAMRSRAEKSEQYFRQRLFERWGDKGDEAKRPPVPKPGQQN